MPFTPFHFGPSLLIGYLLRRRMDFLTFLVASVILDVHAALVFLGILSGPAHGLFHNSYLGAFVVALVFAGIVLLIYRRLPSIAQQVSSRPESPKAVMLASVAGTWLHVTLDAFMHSGMQPFYPLSGNPLYGLIGGFILYGLCALAFIVFVGIVGISLIRNRRKHGSVYGESDRGPSKNLMAGIIIGIVVAIVVGVGASATTDAVGGVGTPHVTVERINSTHAAVSWSTEKPANGTLHTYIQFGCNESWIAINSVNDGVSRTHLVIAPIYELNKSQINRTLASLPENSYFSQYNGTTPVRYEVGVSVLRNGDGARKTILKRTLSQACPSNGFGQENPEKLPSRLYHK